jgi:hypothetical protein
MIAKNKIVLTLKLTYRFQFSNGFIGNLTQGEMFIKKNEKESVPVFWNAFFSSKKGIHSFGTWNSVLVRIT